MKQTDLYYNLQKFLFFFLFIWGFQNYAQSSHVLDTTLAAKHYKKADSLLGEWQYESSITLFKKALPIYEQMQIWNNVVNCYNKISENQWRKSAYEASLLSAKKALEVSNKYLEKNNLEQANAYVNIGKYYEINISDFNIALDYYQKAFDIRSKVVPKDHYLIADSYNDLGNIQKRKGNYKKALEYQEKALDLRIKKFGETHIISSDSYNNIGTIYFYLWEYDEALAYYKKALEIRKEILPPYHVKIGLIYGNIGLIYNKKERPNIALDYLHKSLVVKEEEQENNRIYLARSFNNIAVIHQSLGHYKKALIYHQRSLKIRKNIFGEFHPKVAQSYQNISFLYKEIGLYNKAVIFNKKAISIKESELGKKHIKLASSYHHLGLSYRSIKKYRKSVNAYEKAIKIKETFFGTDHVSTASTYNNIGIVYKLNHEFNEALHFLNKALKIKTNEFGENNHITAKTLEEIGHVLLAKKEIDSGFIYLKRALTIKTNALTNSNPEIIESLNKIADAYVKTADYLTALQYFDKAITYNTKKNEVPDFHPSNFLDLYLLLYSLKGQAKSYKWIYHANKDFNYLEKSRQTYQKADLVVNSLRQTIDNYEDKVTFSKMVKEIYQEAIETQLLLSKYVNDNQSILSKAFYYAEKSKAQTLKDILNDINSKKFTGLPTDLADLEQDLKYSLSYYQSRIAKEYGKQKIDSTKLNSYENKIFHISRRQDSLNQILEKNHPQYYQLKHQNSVVSASQIQNQLNNKTTLVEFFTSDHITYAFAITKDHLSITQLDTPDLETKIQSFRQIILNKNLDQHQIQGYQLYTMLIAPIEDKLKGNRLVIIPDGPLWHLNFDVLLTKPKHSENPITLPKDYPLFLKKYAISYANSANLLFGQHYEYSTQNDLKQECLAFSFSNTTDTTATSLISFKNLRSSTTDLPGTRKEIASISDIIDGQYYYGAHATESNFKKSAGKYNILHLALHGEVDNDRPENSRLFFTKSKDSIEDNFLYTHELFALDIPAELTVLSACNTGSGKIAKGEGIMSLGNAFQYAGTKSLLLTNWAVSDDTTPVIMKSFYTNLKEGMSKDKALQQAKLQYLNTEEFHYLGEPFYWGGFYLIGDTSPIPFSSYNWLYWTLATGIIFLIFIGFLIKRRKSKK